jgi:CheY-like chemotaxis protein
VYVAPLAVRRAEPALRGRLAVVLQEGVVVDDNATNRRALHGQLTAWGMRSVEVASGAEAVAALGGALATEPFDLVLLDMQMPDMDGEQTAAAIKRDARLASIPLVLLSSLGTPAADELQAKGFAAGLAKPARASRLFTTLAQVLASAATRHDTGREPAAPGQAVRLGLRVLLAEDNLINQRFACRMLEKWGCQVDAVADGREAVTAWERARYDVVLMDVQMPVMDGYDATAEIRRREIGRERRTPIVAMTAHAMPGDDTRCLEAGMDDYIAKPVNPDLFRRMLVRWTSSVSEPATAPPPHLGWRARRTC